MKKLVLSLAMIMGLSLSTFANFTVAGVKKSEGTAGGVKVVTCKGTTGTCLVVITRAIDSYDLVVYNNGNVNNISSTTHIVSYSVSDPNTAGEVTLTAELP